jgi:hypothetical protein
MVSKAVASLSQRVAERRRAVALAHHFREAEGLSIGQIADLLGRSPATIKAYFYDPTGEKARAVKARYRGVCRGCGAYTQPRNGKGDAYAYCKACHPGAIAPRWTRDRVVGCDARLARALRPAADVVRLVAHARASAPGGGADPGGRRKLARGQRRHSPVRHVGNRPRGSSAARAGGSDQRVTVGDIGSGHSSIFGHRGGERSKASGVPTRSDRALKLVAVQRASSPMDRSRRLRRVRRFRGL